MLDDLVIAVESETQFVDIGRVSGFMQKVKWFLYPYLCSPAYAVSAMRRFGMV